MQVARTQCSGQFLMKNMVSADPSEILGSKTVGPKAIRLAEMLASGIAVPRFRVIESSTVESLAHDCAAALELLKQITQEVGSTLGGSRFAVRSAALSEDGDTRSDAGRFKTIVDVPLSDVSPAIKEVIRDAKSKGAVNGGNHFSLIIQEYVPADYAGVVFTRNPIAGREMIVEWRTGPGAEVVGGSAVARKSVIPSSASEPFEGFQSICKIAVQIENMYEAPQDIEWVLTQWRALDRSVSATYHGLEKKLRGLPRDRERD
jgi:phosphoenolpyruvate synthase/pyruvate phosphate dikinase